MTTGFVSYDLAQNFNDNSKQKHMENKTTRGRSQDRSKVAGGQDYEVNYEAKKTSSSKKEVKNAVKQAGNSRSKVEKKLK